ncbi:hypothetical protein PkoCFBP13504_00805 [Pseudomonas koreensis]|nr:hypothetical protein PkoCFBP13504_00805 [Pseudomonas koreensis]
MMQLRWVGQVGSTGVFQRRGVSGVCRRGGGLCFWCVCGFGVYSAIQSKAPHPNPPETSDRPEGEGTDRGILKRYADVRVFF